MSPYASVPRLWPSETVVCIGSGPSLTAQDVDYCRGKARVIAINDAIRLAPWADAIYACDGKWIEWHKGVKSYPGPKYSLTVNLTKWPAWTRLRNDGVNGLCLKPDGVRTGRNSGYQAINLAVHFGASRILLLGYDMMRHGGRGHFFGEHPKGTTPSPYRAFLDAFKTIVEPLQALNIEVINCTRKTALEVFPRMAIDQALQAQALAEAV